MQMPVCLGAMEVTIFLGNLNLIRRCHVNIVLKVKKSTAQNNAKNIQNGSTDKEKVKIAQKCQLL